MMERIANGVKEFATKKITWTETLVKPIPIEEEMANNPDFVFNPGDLPIDEMNVDEVEELKKDQYRHWCIQHNVHHETETYEVEKEHYCYASDVIDYEEIIRGKANATDIVVTVLIDELDYAKADAINSTKLMLEDVLSKPKRLASGGIYNISKDKQVLLSAEISKYIAAREAGIDYDLKWNEAGKEAVPLDFATMVLIQKEIDDVVQPIVEAQRTVEVGIKNAESKEAITELIVAYSNEIGYGASDADDSEDAINGLANKISDVTKSNFES